MRRHGLLLAVLALGGTGCTEHVSPPIIRPDDDPSSTWQDLIAQTSSEAGVDYATIAAQRPVLDWYLGWVAYHGPLEDDMKENSEDRRLAFLLNAYDALVVEGVLRANGAGLDRHFWDDTAFRVDGDWITPERFAEERLVARFQEPLLRLALFRADRGGPVLGWWDEDKLSDELSDNARAFLASDRGMRPQGSGWAASALVVDHADDILDWGEADTLCAWLARYTTGPRQAWLLTHQENCPLGVFPVDPASDALPAR